LRIFARSALVIAALLIGFGPAPLALSARATPLEPAAAPQPKSEIAAQLARWVLASGDNGGLPFIIIDKIAAEVMVFGPEGELRGATPALLGFARGDKSVPGIGDRDLEAIRPGERTTPAGRFLSSFGPSYGNADVFWVDYATAISLHAAPTSNPKERRLHRLRTPSPADNRITYGCINVSSAFYKGVVRPTFTGTKGVVYILPEKRPLDEVFPTFALQSRLGGALEGGAVDASEPQRGARSVTSLASGKGKAR
jgi:hypothetical protein